MLKMVSRLLTKQPCLQHPLRFAQAAKVTPAATQAINALQKHSVNPNMRSFTVSATSSSNLARVIQEELEFEEAQNAAASEDPAVPSGWSIKSKPGSALVEIEKDFEGEKITVKFSVKDKVRHEEDAFNEEEEEQQVEAALDDASMPFEVTVAKHGQELQFDCQTDGSFIDIDNVALLRSGQSADLDIYDGPEFYELDDKLQDAFKDYLEDRGLESSLMNFVKDIADSKEQKEYISWMKNLEVFLRK